MLRLATDKEIEFYEKVLYPIQDEIFKLIQSDMFYLSGGTCISRFYYDHRYSDDLDFFFDGHTYPKEEFDIEFRKIVERIGDNFETEIISDGLSFKRIIVYKEQQPLKIEFIYEHFKTVGERKKTENILIDSKENIATNKLTAIQDRKTFKDYVDLYFLLKEIEFEKIVEWAKYKIVPLDYEGLLLAFGDQALGGDVLMKTPLTNEELHAFAKKLMRRILDDSKHR